MPMNTSTIRPEGQKIARGWPFTEGPSEGESEQKGAESALLSLESAEKVQKEAQKEKKLVRKGQKSLEK